MLHRKVACIANTAILAYNCIGGIHMEKVILLNKPAGMTSFDAVAKCRRIFKEKRVGHTGTLDPNATGLMIILLGKCTKLLPYCLKNHKHYKAEFVLGTSTTTEDIWGEVIEEKAYAMHTQEELDEVSKSFVGDIMQVPPMYSAIKKDGKKLYELAREGVEIEREARPCTINSLHVEHIEGNRYAMDAVVSSGTYIRTLIKDYCNALGELGTMSKLERVGIEHLSLDDAVTLEELEELKEDANFLEPLKVLDPIYPQVEIYNYQRILNGKIMKLDNHNEPIVIFKNDKKVLAAYELKEDGVYHCLRGLF